MSKQYSKSRFKIVTMPDGTEVLMERYVNDEDKAPAIHVAFFAENEDVTVKITMSNIYKDTDEGETLRDQVWNSDGAEKIAAEYHAAGMKMFNDAISKEDNA